MTGAGLSSGASSPARPVRFGRVDLFIVLGLAALCFAVYANAIGGAFVYDDDRQIVSNPLIQENRFVGRALVSDVWAFHRAGPNDVGSNYWRPTFIAWLIANHRAFGLPAPPAPPGGAPPPPVGWHLANIALHALCTGLGYWLCRRLGLSRAIAGAVGVVFAVHPAHVESVAWVSGSPDLLMGAAMLGSLLCLLSWERRSGGTDKPPWACPWPRGVAFAGAVLLYAIAQGAKEAAALFPIAAGVLIATGTGTTVGSEQPTIVARVRRGVLGAIPFLAVTALWVWGRMTILHAWAYHDPTATSWGSAILSAPEIGATYLRQLVFPAWIAPAYPIRPVVSPDLMNFIIPVLVCTGAGLAALWAAWRWRAAAIGLTLLALPLVPALNIRIFPPDQIVHDRYLYVSVLGGAMIAGAAVDVLWRRPLRDDQRTLRAMVGGTALVAVAALLGTKTLNYSRVWTSNVALWEAGVKADPKSPLVHSQLGVAYSQANRNAEARTELEKSLDLMELRQAYLALASLDLKEERWAEAERVLRAMVKAYPDYSPGYESLALALERQNRLDDAATVLREGRSHIPARACTLTDMLAKVLRQKADVVRNRAPVDEAIRELESVRSLARNETAATGPVALYRLGLLYGEVGRVQDGLAAFEEYLKVTEGMDDALTLDTRRRVQAGFDAMRRQGR